MLKRHHTENKAKAEINIAPLTDVMLVLLVIFIVITPSLTQSKTTVSQLKVQLPVASKVDKAQPNLIKVTVHTDGRVVVNDQLVAPDNLRAEIEKRLQANPTAALAVYADLACKYQNVVTVVDAAKQAGVRHVALAIRNKEKAP